MKKLILVALVLVMAGVAMADTWNYAWPSNQSSKSFDSLIMIAAVTDTSVVYWFKKDGSEAQVWLDNRCKGATGTAYKHPLIEYKWIDGAGNAYGADSANSWLKLCDSSHVSISAAAHVYMKKLLSNKTGIKGIQFKGAINVDSTITKIRITE